MEFFKEKIQPYIKPFKWFAWYPVWAWDKDDLLRLVWLQTVWRTNGYHIKLKHLTYNPSG